MTSPLSPEIENFIAQQVASGNFADRYAVIESGLRLLMRDREGVQTHEDLRRDSTNSWPAGFFDDIRIEDPAFNRPPQGNVTPSPELD